MNIYRKIRKTSYISLILSISIALYKLINSYSAIIANFYNANSILLGFYKMFSIVINIAISYGCIIVFNAFVLSINKYRDNKNLMFILITFGIACITYTTYYSFTSFIDSIVLYTRFIIFFRAFFIFIINGSILALTINQFITYYKYYQNSN